MRLDKYIAGAKNISRTDSKKIIKSKKIIINQKVVTDCNYNVLDNDLIYYDNELLIYKENVYIMMNKPKGYVCANEDNYHKTVFELLDNNLYNKNKLFTVGRLDIDTTGFLLITSDGDFSHKLTSPKSNVLKKYYVEVDNDFPFDFKERLEDGLLLKDDKKEWYKTKPAFFTKLDIKKGYIEVTEGKFHEVKRMCECFGLTVLNLSRKEIGLLKLDDSLKEGEYRELTEDEINKLKI